MLGWLNPFRKTAPPQAKKPAVAVSIRGHYDAAQTTPENRRHWANADFLAVNAATRPEVRRVLRARARYEVANNGYAHGIVQTLANYVIGTGPRLQMLLQNAESNRIVEREFARWAKAIGLARKLRTMRISQCESGECFALLATNPAINSPVKLDVRPIEADQVAAPWSVAQANPDIDDGIRFDAYGNPTEYCVLRKHPGDHTALNIPGLEFDLVPVRSMIHLYKEERPGQRRGVPEITSSLSLFATLRRYTMAVLSAAEQAALIGGVIHTDAPPDGEGAEVEPLDEIEMNRGTWMTMPAGWKPTQVKAEQPTTVYPDFKHEIVDEIARPINMPSNVARGNSSGYNYASGRLDHQAFFKSIRIDQAFIADVVLDRIFEAWFQEAVLIEGFLPDELRDEDALTHQWFWDGLEHVDPAKEANAQATRLQNHTTNLAAEYAKAGLDWEMELRQRARELALMRELGLPIPNEETSAESEKLDDEEADDKENAYARIVA